MEVRIDNKKSWAPKNWCLWTVLLEKTWESLGEQDQTSQSLRKSTLNIHWKDRCWSWSSNTFVAWCKEPQFSSVAQSCPTLCNPMNRSTPGLPVHHQIPEFTQTHVHRVSDAIQPSHPLSSTSPPAPNPSSIRVFSMSQLFAWGGQSTGVSALASFLAKKSQGWSPSEWTGWISLQSKGLSRVFSNTTIQKHQFFGTQLSSQSNSHINTWIQEKP